MLQIVSFDNPYPPNFGGVIDVFFKIKSLAEAGIKIQLHFFYTDRDDFSELEKYCENIYSYKRNVSFYKHFQFTPFRVSSRFSKQLLLNLNKSKAPILFEGLHSTSALMSNELDHRIIFRAHNIEHVYIKGLAKSESHFLKKIIYLLEAYKQKKYQKILSKATVILTLSKSDCEYFKSKFNAEVFFIPAYHGNVAVKSKTGNGEFALYHGDLSSSDNQNSAMFLIDVFGKLDHTLIIAGSFLPDQIKGKIKNFTNIQFKKITEEKDLNSLLDLAHINVLHSNQNSGTKLKVFNALYKGKHCIINKNIVDDLTITDICTIVNTKSEYRNAINNLFNQKYILDRKRIEVLDRYLPNTVTANLLESLKLENL